VGANRDEFIVVRKMNKIDWLEESDQDAMPTEVR
jgi:nitrate reductase alpha subunit